MLTLLFIFILVLVIGVCVLIYVVIRTRNTPKKPPISAVQQRERFISIISHQLRTPLSIVRGYLESLENGDVGVITDKQKEYLTEAQDITKNMISMVNLYLDVMTKDQADIKPVKKSVDLTALVSGIAARFRLYARATNVEIETHFPKQALLLQTDANVLRGVLENIVSNAVKYTEKSGTVILTLADDGRGYVFTCQDNGIGIPLEEQKELFSRFFRASNIVHRSIAGSGLGLYLAKAHITALGGKIWFTSTPGKGTAMYVSLPK